MAINYVLEKHLAAEDIRYTSPLVCAMCGRNSDLEDHHVMPKQMGGRKRAAKRESEEPRNKLRVCRVCHSARHGIRVILLDGFCCERCREADVCRFAKVKTSS